MNLKKESMSVRLSNADDAARAYTVSAEVRIAETGTVSEISDGEVREATDQTYKANFCASAHSPLSVNFSEKSTNSTEMGVIFQSIQEFIASAHGIAPQLAGVNA